MLDHFLFRAVLGAVGVAFAAAPLGVFVVWRRMAYFGDATAHAAILGVALALASSVPVFAGTLLVALMMGFAVAGLTKRGAGADMILGVASHAALAFGLVAVTLVEGPRLDLQAYLFGDILAVGKADLALIWGGAIMVWLLLMWRWQGMLLSTMSSDLAYASNINPEREKQILMLALALVVAVAIKIVGALLIGAMLIIPAATARPFARTPEQMVLGAAGLGICSALLGLWGAWELDTPAGPSIVCAAALLFGISTLFGRKPAS